jgi:hypothetical protein
MSDTTVWPTPLSRTDKVKLNAVTTMNPAPTESIINFQTGVRSLVVAEAGVVVVARLHQLPEAPHASLSRAVNGSDFEGQDHRVELGGWGGVGWPFDRVPRPKPPYASYARDMTPFNRASPTDFGRRDIQHV